MSDRRVSKEELGAFWRGDKNTYQRMYSDRMQQKADEAEKQGKQVTYIPNDGSATLPEVSITAPRETEELKLKRLKLDYENFTDNAITAAGFVPGADTFADIADIGNSWRKGDYSGMLWGLAGVGLPISGKALKSGWNLLKNILSIRNYRAAKEISSDIDKGRRFIELRDKKYLENLEWDPTKYLSYSRVGKPETDSETFYHYMNVPFGQPITARSGQVRLLNNAINPVPGHEGPEGRIWWNKGSLPSGNPSILITSKSNLIDERVVDHPEKYSMYHGLYEPTYYTSGSIPLKDIQIYKKNPFTGHYDYKKITYKHPYNQSNSSKVADFSKALSNIQLLDKMDEFANKYGYPLSDRSTILSNTRTNKLARQLIARHNTYLRGVRPGTADDILIAKNALGKDNVSDLEFMQYAATHPRPSYKDLWISPEENAFIYGGAGNTAYVRRKYQLGKNRNKWFTEGDFKVLTNPYLVGKSWDDATGIYAPWDNYREGVAKGPETELISTEDLNFAGWADFNNWRHRTSLNDRVLDKPDYLIHWKKGGKL